MRVADPWYLYWARFVIPLVATFALGGALAGRFAPVTAPTFRRLFIGVNVIFLLWSAASWLQYGGLIPDWETGTRFLLIGAGSPLGVLIHFAWWLIADVLLALAWIASRFMRRAAAS